MTSQTASATDARLGAIEEPVLARPVRGLWADAFRQFRRHRLAMFGLVVFTFLLLAVFVGPLVYTVPIDEIDMTQRLDGPSRAHPMGTDDLGQDLLARILYGGRISMAVGLLAMVIALTVGLLVGSLSGYFAGFVDSALMRLTDLLIALPQLPLLLLVIYLFRDKLRQMVGPEMGVFILIVVVIGGLRWMSIARLVRAQFLSIKEKEYIEAARALGAPSYRIMLGHMLPNSLSPVFVAASLGVAAAILAESTLSFLGLGFPPDMPTWGRLLADARDRLEMAPHAAIFPGLMIFFTVLSINFIGDGLRDALDPRRTP
jgi:peptide/nickel transport system permease protein